MLAERGKVMGFLNNIKDGEALAGLAEDIRDAMMDYQVRLAQHLPELCLIPSQDCAAARHLP